MPTHSVDQTIIRDAQAAFMVGLEESKPQVDVGRFITRFDHDRGGAYKWGWFGSIPYPVERTSTYEINSLFEYTHSLEDKEWVLGLGITEKLIEDDETGVIAVKRARGIAARAMRFLQKRFADILKDGDDGTIHSAYDGGNMFATNHTVRGTGGTVSNQHTESGVTTPSAPTAAELEGAIDGTLQLVQQMVDDQGNPMVPDGEPVFLIPQNLASSFRRVGGAAGAFGRPMNNPATSTGGTGEFSGMRFEILPELNDENDRFYALYPAGEDSAGPFVHVDRLDWGFRQHTPDDDQQANMAGAYTQTARSRWEIGPGLYQKAYQCILAS